MTHTIHDPKIHALPYPENLMYAIAKADLINPETKELKPPIVEINSDLENFVKTYIPYELTKNELRVIRKHYVEHQSLIDIASSLDYTSENIRVTRNKALNKILKCYLVTKPESIPKEFSHVDISIPHAQYDPSRVPLAELKPDSSSEYMFKTLEGRDPFEHIITSHKLARNSIQKPHISRKNHKKLDKLIPSKFYIRTDGILYIELKDETKLYQIGQHYSYSNSNFIVEGDIIDICFAGILLDSWEVKRK